MTVGPFALAALLRRVITVVPQFAQNPTHEVQVFL